MVKVHRSYRHTWQRSPKEITTRDCQAMLNFSAEGISDETIAQHFGCSVEYVSEQILFRPWLQPEKSTENGYTWGLDDIKLALDRLDNARQGKRDWSAYFKEEYGEDYTLQSDDTKQGLIEWAESLPAGYVPALTFS